MSSLNKVILIGNLGKPPEIRRGPNGTIASFTLATSEKWKDKATGELKDKTEWHKIVCFNDRLCDVIERYIKKGSKIYLEGSLNTRKWSDKDGQEKYTTEVVISKFKGEIVMLGGNEERETLEPSNFAGTGMLPPIAQAPNNMGTFNDEIPF